jgi:hypothetical protein
MANVAAAYDVKIHRAKVIEVGDVATAQLEFTGTAHATGAGAGPQFHQLYTVDGDMNHLRQRRPEGHQNPRRAHRGR